PFVLAFCVVVLIVRAPLRWLLIVSFGCLAAILLNMGWHIFGVLRQGNHAPTAEGILIILILGFAAIGLVLSISLMTRQRRKIDQAHAEVEAVEHDRDVISSEMTRQTEREYLAREVHDTLAQRLTALSLQTGQMQKSLAVSEPGELAAALQETKHYSDQALRDLRTLVSSLRDQAEQEPLVPSVAPAGLQDLRPLLDEAAKQVLKIYPPVLLNRYASSSVSHHSAD